MRFVPISMAQPGMKVASDLFDFYGRIVISKESSLTEHYIMRLIELGFAGVYITDEISADIEMEEAIPFKLRKAGIDCLKKADIEGCTKIAKDIVKDILSRENVCLDMADLRSFDDYTFAHSVNVAVLSCVLGIGFKLSESDLEKLTLSALLHDLGKLQISTDIVNKPSRLTRQEYEIIKSHPVKSYELLKDRDDISAVVKQTVLFHHENVDGSGYPQGITKDDMSMLVKILHVADVYDSLVSKRTYKEPYSPCEAAEYLMGACGIMFDQEVVARFLKLVPLYPKGMEIRLSDGTSGIVLENSGVNNLRPIVRQMNTMKRIDLSDREYLSITIVNSDSERVGRNIQSEHERNIMVGNSQQYKVMVVDDMATNLQLIKEILEAEYELILIKSGKQAINYIEKIGEVDLIIMDIDMPEMTGVEAAEKIVSMCGSSIPILFVSTICDRETVLMCKSLGAAGYIARPYKSVYIKSEIRRILDGTENY